MSKKTTVDKKDEKKTTVIKEEKPKYEEIIFSNLSNPQLTFDHTGYAFSFLQMDVMIIFFY